MRKILTLLVLLSALMSSTSRLLTVGDSHRDHSVLVDVEAIAGLEFASMKVAIFEPVEMPPRVVEARFTVLPIRVGSRLPSAHHNPGAALRKALSSYIL